LGWSLGYLPPPKEPELLDHFFLAVGKALFLASNFEEKCRFVLRIAKLVHEPGLLRRILALQKRADMGDASAATALVKALREKTLHQTLSDIRGLSEVRAADVVLLERGKEARNFIAHEVAVLGTLPGVRATQIHDRIALLRSNVEALTAADNVVSRWVYEIEEKEPAPRAIQEAYPRWAVQWVFKDFDD
jgi:orotidine-5'-phosphate decarboxylase